MSTPALPESPIARLLLELATLRTSCELTLEARTLVLVEGALVDLRGHDDDRSLPAFLAAAGRIEERERQVVEERIRDVGLTVDQALAELSDLDPEVVHDTRRALLLDRLVRAFAAFADGDGVLPKPQPLRSAARARAFDLVELVLDALARRAAHGDAELIGQMRQARFVWEDAPAQKRAASWAELGEIPHAMSVATLFPRHPAAPSRIAALVRAGVARLDAGATLAPAAKASVKPSVPVVNTVVVAPSPPATASDDDGAPTQTTQAHGVLGPLGIKPVQSWLPETHTTLGDPLSSLEAAAAQLAASQASPAERAAAWLRLSQAFHQQMQSSAEATRAAREAAAADPSDPLALAAAARLTGATGAPAMAYAYARAWATIVQDTAERARAWSLAAEYARRAERPHEQRLALKAASEALPDDAQLQEQLARALARNDERLAAVEQARKAAELLRGGDTEHARVVLSWAAELLPNNLRTWNDLAKNLVRAGRSNVGVATLAHAARQQTDSAIRERLRLSGIAFAELATQRESAIELLLEALDSGSALSEPLLAHLHAVSAWVEIAIIAEQLAKDAKGTERAALLVDAAEARAQLRGGAPHAIELMTQAMLADPESVPVYDALAALTVEHDSPDALIEALERAVRSWEPPTGAELDAEREAKLKLLLTRIRELPVDATTAPLTEFAETRWARLHGAELDAETASKLEDYRARFDTLAQRLEQELRAAEPHERTAPGLRLASLLRQDPARRTPARKLYEKVLERDPQHVEAQRGLESLLLLEGDHATLDAIIEQRATQRRTPETLLALAYRRQRAGKLDDALAACSAGLALLDDAQARGNGDTRADVRHELLVLRWRLAISRGDLAVLQTALEALSAEAPSAERRASILMRLWRVQRARGERAAAIATAELALADGSAEAALALLHDMVELSIAPKISVLRALHELLGDTPELLRQLARAAFSERDPRAQREALEALARITPEDGFAARSLVALQTTGRDAAALRKAIERALDPTRFGKQSAHVLQPALQRLGALTDLEESVRLVLAAVDTLGEQARPLLGWAHSVRDQLPTLALRAEVLEQWVAHTDPAERPSALQTLAALRREQGMLWAAARTELRLLALSPSDTAALERLAAVYAETGEFEKLDAALLLLGERAASEDERLARSFERAVVLARLGHDADGALRMLEEAFAPTERDGRDVPLETLRNGVGMLYAVAPEQAFALLLRLAQRATLERARDLIEEAVFMAEHRMGRPDLALNAASQGSLRQPQHERFVATMERLARSTGQSERLVATLEEAAERCDVLPRQAELLIRAAQVSEQQLEDATRASLLLDRAYRATPTKAVEELVLACAGRLFARDVRAGKLAYDRLRDTLHVRAKFGAPIGRIYALLTLARLAADVYLNREDALGYVEAARAALAGELPELERDQATVELEALATRLSAGTSVRPLSRAPDKQRKSLVNDLDQPLHGLTQSAPTFRPAASLSPPVAMTPIARIVPITQVQPARMSLAQVTVRPGERPSLSSDVSIEGLPPLPQSTEVTRSPESLINAVSAGDSAALRQLADLLQREPERSPAVCKELLARARDSHFHVCSLRALRLASAGAHEHALWRTSSQALAFIEPPLRPPPSGRRRDTRSSIWHQALAAARETPQQPGLTLLGQLVDGAAPLFRKPLATLSTLGKDPPPLEEAPFGPLLNDLANTFGTRHDAYLAKSGEDRVSLLSVLPANLIIGDRTPPDTSSLRYRMARAYESARSENALLATQTQAFAQTLLTAVTAAFSDSTPQQVPREAAALAADLWRTMPSKAQRTLAALLKALPAPLVYADLLAAVQLRTARVALLATRELDVALAQLGLDGDPDSARTERSEGALNRALRDQPLVHALLRYAFSDAYLAAVVEAG